jgi:hypothetical protein
VPLWLGVIAYKLGNLWRRLVLPTRIDDWSLTSLQQWLVKLGGRLVKHARYYWLLLAWSRVTRPLFGSLMADRLAALADGISEPQIAADFRAEEGRGRKGVRRIG